MWVNPPNLERQLIESKEFSEQAAALGNLPRLDDALVGVTWALSTNPEVFDVVKGMKDVRMLKTDPHAGLPPFRIWFRIDENGQHVHLLAIEAIAVAE
jgi:hypothetical protein